MQYDPLEKFFQRPATMMTWKKGKQLVEELKQQVVDLPDGIYRAQVIRGRFENTTKGRALHILEFLVNEKTVIVKPTAMESAERIALAIVDLDKIGISVSVPLDLRLAYTRIERRRPIVEISITTENGVRRINIIRLVEEDGRGVSPEEIVPVDKVPAQQPTAEKTQIVFKAQEEESPAKATEDDVVEVDIKVGDKIMINLNGNRYEANVVGTFDADSELAVQLIGTNQKLIIPAEDVIAQIK